MSSSDCKIKIANHTSLFLNFLSISSYKHIMSFTNQIWKRHKVESMTGREGQFWSCRGPSHTHTGWPLIRSHTHDLCPFFRKRSNPSPIKSSAGLQHCKRCRMNTQLAKRKSILMRISVFVSHYINSDSWHCWGNCKKIHFHYGFQQFHGWMIIWQPHF